MKKHGLLLWFACLIAASAVMFAQDPRPEPRPARSAGLFHKSGGSYLGIAVAEIDSERAKELRLSEERGVEIKSVAEGSPAAQAGLKEGDVVLEFNGHRVEGTEQFVRLVRETPPGRKCTVVVSRNGTAQTITATLDHRPAAQFAFAGVEPFEINIPPIPPIPPIPYFGVMPDIPKSTLTWRNSALGIEGEAIEGQLADYFGVKEGVLVKSVVQDSAGGKAGILAGDIIVKVGDDRVNTPREITAGLRSARARKSAALTVVRKGKEMVLEVKLDDNAERRRMVPVRYRL